MDTFESFTVAGAVVRSAEIRDTDALVLLCRDLYKEDQKIDIDDAHMQKTINVLSKNPEKGTVIVIEKEGTLIGYMIVIHYWSNEYGGNIATVDEIFLLSDERGKGLGTGIFESIIAQKPWNSVAVQLETTPDNARSRSLYEKLGFVPYKNQQMIYTFVE